MYIDLSYQKNIRYTIHIHYWNTGPKPYNIGIFYCSSLTTCYSGTSALWWFWMAGIVSVTTLLDWSLAVGVMVVAPSYLYEQWPVHTGDLFTGVYYPVRYIGILSRCKDACKPIRIQWHLIRVSNIAHLGGGLTHIFVIFTPNYAEDSNPFWLAHIFQLGWWKTTNSSCCWWFKNPAITSWYGKSLSFLNRVLNVLYISTGAGFRPLTVCFHHVGTPARLDLKRLIWGMILRPFQVVNI